MAKKEPAYKKAGKQDKNSMSGEMSNLARKRKANRFPKKKIDEILAQAREFQRVGQHEKAIDLCTQTLDSIGEGSSLTIQMQMDLLITRFDSNLFHLKRKEAGSDITLLMELADRTDKPNLKAKALIGMGRIQANQGQNNLARKTLSTALKLAQQSGQKRLEAETLVALWGVQSGEQQIKNVKHAVDIYLSQGDKYQAGLALTRVAGSFRLAGRIDEARHAAHQALEICKEVGNVLGVGHAYNTLSNTDTDLVLRLKHQKLSSQAFEVVGNLGQLAGTANNLGYIYYDLGLYSRAQRYYRKALEIYPAHFYPLANRIYTELEIKALTQASEHIAELQTMIREKKIYNYDLTIMTDLLGRMALLEGKPKAAIRHFKSAIRFSREAGHAKEIGMLTWLGLAQLAMEEPLAALRSTTKAVKMHRERNFPFIDDHPSQGIWWQHAQVLHANQKPETADKALEKAYEFLLNEIGNMHDAGLRRNYFNKVAINREIIQDWLDYATRKKLPRERRYAHLEIKSRAREPFSRLAEVGLELNALHTVKEIQTFLVDEAVEVIGGERVLLILGNKTSKALRETSEVYVAESYLPVGEDSQRPFAVAKKYLEKARISRTVQLLVPKGKGRSRIIAPLVAQNRTLGYLYTEMDSIYGVFDETDRDMLGMLANQGAVALENALTLEGLERTVEQRTQALQISNADLQQRNSELALINAVQVTLSSILDAQEIFEVVGEQFRILSDYQAVRIYTFDLNKHTVSKMYDCKLGKRFPPCAVPGNSLFNHLIKSLEPIVINGDFPDFAANFKDYQVPQEETPRSILSISLKPGGDEQNVILLTLQNMDGERSFNAADVRLLETIAGLTSAALERKHLRDQEKAYLRALERELEIGRDIQMSFLPPELPVITGWEVAASLKAAREVAGDFYDVFTPSVDNNVCLVIGDVCDKGVGAALFMTLFRSLLRFTMVATDIIGERSHAEKLKYAVTLTNNYIANTHGETSMFATIFFALLDPKSGELTYINAGHEAPLIVHDGVVQKSLAKTGIAVGIMPDWDFEVQRFQLASGDLLFAFTDGVPDAENGVGGYYGKERLYKLFNAGMPALSVVDELNNQLREYMGGSSQADDITVLAVQRM